MKTTVVGSYPVPDWLKAAPGEQALEDAMALVLESGLPAATPTVDPGLATDEIVEEVGELTAVGDAG